jgi:hypothetical protein
MRAGAILDTSLRGSGLLEGVDYRRIETLGEKDQLYSMRYKAYRHGELIPPSDDQRYNDRFDDAPNAYTFGIYIDGELCSSLRLHVLTPEQRMSYTTELFGDILNPRLDKGEVFVDPARFVADPEKARRFPKLPYLTLRLAYLACDYFDADTGLALVRPGHQAFYRQVFMHQPIAEPRQFPNALVKVALMASDFRASRERVLARFPILRSSALERHMLFRRSEESLAPMFEGKSSETRSHEPNVSQPSQTRTLPLQFAAIARKP